MVEEEENRATVMRLVVVTGKVERKSDKKGENYGSGK